MARSKSVCVKWTLVLVLVLCSSFVLSRPQEPTTLSSELDKTTENTIRYRYKDNNASINTNLPLLSNLDSTTYFIVNSLNNNMINNLSSKYTQTITKSNNLTRISVRNERIIQKSNKNQNSHIFSNTNKPVIKKVVTKWTDNAKYEDLDLSREVASPEKNLSKKYYGNNEYSEEYDNNDSATTNVNQKYTSTNKKKIPTRYHRPQPQYSEETQAFSSNMQVVDNHAYPHMRPTYIYTTPSPTPIITNVGYPRPWQQSNVQNIQKPIRKRPVIQTRPQYTPNYDTYYHHTPYPDYNFEVTTFKTPVFTDRIVIRPEEYNAPSDDCPTIYLTLNNTFKGEGKEACPDLNIAVNTNVINKNVVVESEENTDSTLTDIFGLPYDDSDSDENPNTHDYKGSNENEGQSDSASIEGLSLTNYNAASDLSEDSSSDTDNSAAPSNALSEIKRPNRPSKDKNDLFDFDSIYDLMQPIIGGFSWLAAINPFSFSAVSLFLTPVILAIAAISGIFAVFSSFTFPFAREAPAAAIESPTWQWDEYYKTWYLDSFANSSRRWHPELPRSFLENNSSNKIPMKLGLFDKIKQWLQSVTMKININRRTARKNKRKERETWTRRVK